MGRLIRVTYCFLFLLFSTNNIDAVEMPAVEVQLAKGGAPLMSVFVSAKASESVKKSAADLSLYLGKISGATFKVETGDGSTGIVVGTPAEFSKLPFENMKFGEGPFEREDYLLRSTAQGLYLMGASDLAVSDSVWDLLHRLGYRQYFPGEVWEVLPHNSEPKISIDLREHPSFYARRIWYNWGLWGYNEVPYRDWCVRNRMIKGFDLNSGHAYESIIAQNKAEFDQHPEYFALQNGVRRTSGGDIKFCVSNPGLRQLVAAHAARVMRANPKLDSISIEPSDGGNWCECAECAKMSGVSNRVLTLANVAAEEINKLGLGDKYVGILSYNKHSAPPTIRANPHVIVSATTAFIGGGFSFDQVVEGWKAQGATMGVYDYLSVVDWDWNLPRGASGSRPDAVAAGLAKFHSQGTRFYDAESGDCWGPCGLGYYVASRVLWDVNDAKHVDAIFDDFLDNAFGEAKAPMREFYQLINRDTQRRSPSDILGRMYLNLDAARKATHDPAVLARIDHLILYTRYAELYYALANGTGKVEDVARFAYRIRKTMMVHSYGLWSRLLSQQAALTPNHPLKSDAPFAQEELNKFVLEGMAHNKPVEPGFSSIEFSRKLTPASAVLKLPKVAPGQFPSAPQDFQEYYIWVPEGADSIDLKVAVQKVWANRKPVTRLYSPQEVSLNPVAVDESYKPDGVENELKLRTPYGGLHRVQCVDGGDHTLVKWPEKMPVTVESGIDTPNVLSHFRGAWTLYFYVPKGTKIIGGWASRIANWAPRISGKLVDPDGKTALDFGTSDEGWFKVPVAAGQDGKLWKFDNTQGQRLLMTVPPFLARSSEELLLPAEVLAADK